ncbi:hypothetical protein [Citreimonas salinaria]|uniref:Uncharacterized protein n=1 Tax=Citreimonas salinaria TaxID=321339 RepID=A0A1H3N7W1_9RHOB|nr:hypothetical protein [Citreimonas salinaria]SDY84962.1 hypothetical protein SAMN05444340_12131 [Citreimonas salinaria]
MKQGGTLCRAARSSEIIGVAGCFCDARPLVRGTRIEPRQLHVCADEEFIAGALKDHPGLIRGQILASFDYPAR